MMFERALAGTLPAALIVRASRERRRVAEAMPPLRATTRRPNVLDLERGADEESEAHERLQIDLAARSVFAQALPISLNDWPFYHRSQSSAFRPAEPRSSYLRQIHLQICIRSGGVASIH